uniref:Venom allergen-like protein 1 n=1 Tax=Bursaphelenchus doui TaxID=359799 RepID=F2VLM6_9BILA|nr:venom allergen-like protein 1 [Bursaphelenchus doui]ADV57662.1 venom allergen-like protein 1 [Bursaphelenchus doui]
MFRLLLASALLVGPIVATKYTTSEKQALVDAHNRLRRTLAKGEAQAKNGLMEEGANIREISWDNGLETQANNWAKACNFEHPDESEYGQNLAAQMPFVSRASTLTRPDKWWSEITKYSGNPQLEWGSSTGHFTQMAWAETDKVGCALQNCTNGADQGFSYDNWTFTVCNYLVHGNVIDENIYETGSPCSQCSVGCNDGLCSD